METAINILYKNYTIDKRKERFEMILEPFQAIVQLAALSYYPVGTKLSICNNLLSIQEPSWMQGMMRNYNDDKKDDLIFLFSVVKRFYMYYKFLNTNKNTENFFDLLIQLSSKGIDKLIQTYRKCNNPHLSQTLNMYKQILDEPKKFLSIKETKKSDEDKKNIDSVFQKIVFLYDSKHFEIIYNIFLLLDNDTESYKQYISSINKVCCPVNERIQKWISDNIVF